MKRFVSLSILAMLLIASLMTTTISIAAARATLTARSPTRRRASQQLSQPTSRSAVR